MLDEEDIGGIRSEDVVAALVRSGFAIFRRDPVGTILERGSRAVIVPCRSRLTWFDVASVRRMAGLKHGELLGLLGDQRDEKTFSTSVRSRAAAGGTLGRPRSSTPKSRASP